MKRKIAVIGLLLLLVSLPVFAQEEPLIDDYFGGLHKKGSQIISLSTGAGIPLFILPADALATETSPLGVGASFSLGYQYFIANRLTIGGSLCGAFNSTVGGRTLFVAPVSFKLGYWWGKEPMEYTVSADVGASVLRLSGDGTISPFAKLGGGAYTQISEAWSLGGQVYWWLIPELHFGANSDLTRYANFLEISVGAVYHF
ncbi:MAG TPA: hypothetical protein VN445_07095 [Rectinemataceae bacterium]|nr:hypothetical protein [Rectinemataceae bacterium]